MILSEEMPWPPVPPEVSRATAEWDAWYSGSRNKLAATYAGQQVRPGQLYGGLVGSVSRMLWGRPPTGEHDNRLHLPLAADIAAASSDLLFGEELPVDWGKDPGAERMEVILDGLGWQSLLSEAGELCSALGGVFLRAGWDTDVADHPLATVVAADGAVPTFSFGLLREVTFWTAYDKGGTLYRHTETHRPGEIIHQLWKGSGDKLGKLVPLTEVPEVAGLAEVLTDGDRILTGTDLLTAVYVPNIRPVPMWRRINSAAYLGRSDFGSEGVIGLMDAVDEAWTSWMRDVRHGRSRILAASSILRSEGPGKGAWLDLDAEVYEEVRMPLGDDPTLDKLLKAQQFNIRVEEHSRTIRELTLAVVNGCGYSGSTFGLDTEVAKTATEVGAVRGRTRDTREKKTRYWTPPLERFLMTLAELDRSIFSGPGLREEPRVEFPTFASPTLMELGQTAQALRAAEAASTKTLVQLVHPDWDGDQVAEEVTLITDAATPPPVTIASPFAPDDAEPVPAEEPETTEE